MFGRCACNVCFGDDSSNPNFFAFNVGISRTHQLQLQNAVAKVTELAVLSYTEAELRLSGLRPGTQIWDELIVQTETVSYAYVITVPKSGLWAVGMGADLATVPNVLMHTQPPPTYKKEVNDYHQPGGVRFALGDKIYLGDFSPESYPVGFMFSFVGIWQRD